MAENILYYGDNLDILRRYIKDESVDLIYLDPPFNSNATYNILFKEGDETQSAAQIQAFEDTWHWDQASVAAYQEVVEAGGQVSEAMQAFRQLLGGNDMLAYLSMMSLRVKELYRILKDTGSVYLHCDPTASHYLKILMDACFGPKNFRNEIIWRRTGAHGKAKRFAPIHDVILYYTKSDNYKWNYPKRPYMEGHVEEYFVKDGERWRTNYYGNVLTGSGRRGGESGKPWKGVDPTAKDRHWAIPGRLLEEVDEDLSDLSQHEKLDRLYELGFIKIEEGHAWPVYEHFITPEDGTAVSDIWAYQPHTDETVFGTDEGIDSDVRWLAPKDIERLSYPTQKPLGILGRMIAASSDPEDLVLDPFCGYGTTVEAAERMGRKWIGIDITHLAVTLMKHRLEDAFGDDVNYEIIGEPVSVAGAGALAKEDPFQFQWWALGLVDARPTEQKKGADQGIDGRIYFHDEPKGKTKQIVISVKSGGTGVADVRDLRGVVEREKAAIGAFITLQKTTKPMRAEAAEAGHYDSPWGTQHPRIQILTIEELLEGAGIDYPPTRGDVTFKKAPRVKDESATAIPLFGEEESS